MELMTDEIATALTKAKEEGKSVTSEIEIVVKYFTPDANATWFVIDGEREGDDWRLFGFCDLGDRQLAELGYVMLSELQEVRGKLGLPVERDLYFPRTTLQDVLDQYKK